MEQEYTLEALMRTFAERAVEYAKREQMMKKLYPAAENLVPKDSVCVCRALMVICQEIATLKAQSGAHSTHEHIGDGNEMIDDLAKRLSEPHVIMQTTKYCKDDEEYVCVENLITWICKIDRYGMKLNREAFPDWTPDEFTRAILVQLNHAFKAER